MKQLKIIFLLVFLGISIEPAFSQEENGKSSSIPYWARARKNIQADLIIKTPRGLLLKEDTWPAICRNIIASTNPNEILMIFKESNTGAIMLPYSGEFQLNNLECQRWLIGGPVVGLSFSLSQFPNWNNFSRYLIMNHEFVPLNGQILVPLAHIKDMVIDDLSGEVLVHLNTHSHEKIKEEIEKRNPGTSLLHYKVDSQWAAHSYYKFKCLSPSINSGSLDHISLEALMEEICKRIENESNDAIQRFSDWIENVAEDLEIWLQGNDNR